MPTNYTSINRNIEYILLFLFGLGIFCLEKYFILCFLLILLWNKIKTHSFTVKLRSQVVPLFAFGVTFCFMSIIAGENPNTSIVYYVVAPCTMCSYGSNLMTNEKTEKDFVWYACIVSFGFFVHALVSIVISSQSGLFQYNAEFIKDLWSGRMNNRTIMGMYMVPAVCLSVPLIFESEGEKILLKKALAGFIVGASIMASVFVGNRGLLVITSLLLTISIVMEMKYSEDYMKFWVGLLVVVVASAVAFSVNLFNVQLIIKNSFLKTRSMDLFSDVRFVVCGLVLKNFTKYMLGWISSGGVIIGVSLKWAHNIWLDIFVYGGIVPLIAFIVYSLRIVRDGRHMVNNKYLHPTTKIMVITLIVGIFLIWAIEPVLQSNPYFFSTCAMLFGMYENAVIQDS